MSDRKPVTAGPGSGAPATTRSPSPVRAVNPQIGETWTTVSAGQKVTIVAGPDPTGYYAIVWPDGKLDVASRDSFIKLVRDKPEWIEEFNDGNPSYVYFLDNGDGSEGTLFPYVQGDNSEAKRSSVARAVVNLETFEWL